MAGPALRQPFYTTFDSVRVRLTNKVQFQSDPTNLQEGELPDSLLAQLIEDAETAVEKDLRSRYAIPFRSIVFGSFAQLPSHTKKSIRMLVDWKAVSYVLATDFGRGSHIDPENYMKSINEAYDVELEKELGMDRQGKEAKRFKFSPPLEDLMLAKSNALADDGYRGTIINTDANTHGAEDYAAHQINNPGVTYLNRRIKNPAGG